MGTISKRKRRSFLPASSQLRYAAAYILITAAALFLLNLYASTTIRSVTFHAQADSLESKAQLLSNALLQLDELSAGRAAQAVNSMEELHTTRTVVTDAAGVAVYDSLTTGNAEGKTLLFPELVTALEGSDVFFSRYADGAVESHAAVPLMRGGRTLGAVYLMSYDTDQGELIAALERNILRISFALEGGVVLFSLFFSAAFSRRMRAILNQVGRMREGDYSQQPPVRGHDEVERLSRAFNELAARLESSEARRRQFVSDASHELKTPLASIKLLSDSILQNEMDPETQREFIGDIGREADRLGRLTQKLLTLTKLDSSVEEEREILDAAPVVRKVVRMLLPLARLRGIGIDTTFEPDRAGSIPPSRRRSSRWAQAAASPANRTGSSASGVTGMAWKRSRCSSRRRPVTARHSSRAAGASIPCRGQPETGCHGGGVRRPIHSVVPARGRSTAKYRASIQMAAASAQPGTAKRAISQSIGLPPFVSLILS